MKKKLYNSHGFSLVELIIVIAIMAVLTGILAPQYLRYVEQSKIQMTITNAKTISDAITVLVTDASASGGDTYDKIMALAQDTNPLDLSSDEAAFLRNEIGTDIDGEVNFYQTAEGYISFTYTMKNGKYAVDYNYPGTNHTYIKEEGDYKVYINSN